MICKQAENQNQCIAQRRRGAEKTKKHILGALTRENLLTSGHQMPFCFYPAQREPIDGFLCASASLRDDQVFWFS